jgi:hypothetical protein
VAAICPSTVYLRRKLWIRANSIAGRMIRTVPEEAVLKRTVVKITSGRTELRHDAGGYRDLCTPTAALTSWLLPVLPRFGDVRRQAITIASSHARGLSHASSICPTGAGANGVGRLNGSHQLSFGMESPNALRWRFGALAFRWISGCTFAEIKSRENFRIVLVRIPMAALLLSVAGSAGGAVFGPIGAVVGRITGVLAGSVIDHALSRRYCLLSEDRRKTEPTTAILAKLFPAR